MAITATAATREYCQLIRAANRRPTIWVSYPLVLALTLAPVQQRFNHEDRAIIAIAIIAAFLAQIGRQSAARSVEDWMATLVGPMYIGVLMSYIVLLRNQPGGLAWTAMLFVMVWANDSGAYLVGRKFGRRPFFNAISPKKTLEGAVGGTLASVAVGLAAPFVARLTVPVIARAIAPFAEVVPRVHTPPLAETSALALGVLGLAVAVAAPAGDLAQSFLKRQVGVKDTGDLIPGHGGVWDRIDSLLFAAPVVYYTVVLLERL